MAKNSKIRNTYIFFDHILRFRIVPHKYGLDAFPMFALRLISHFQSSICSANICIASHEMNIKLYAISGRPDQTARLRSLI